MPATSYRTLKAESRFLRGFQLGANDRLNDSERTEAEQDAAIEIEAALGKTFSTGANVPGVIRLLGDLIGSAYLIEYAAMAGDVSPDDPTMVRKAGFLRGKAQEIINDLREHKIGILNPDGTYDGSYPAPDLLPTIEVGEAKARTVVPWLTWGQMAQPQGTQEEKEALDGATRNRRADETAASLAGAYGL